ncbi:protein bric-a-brac 2 isoform X2 [Drosophila eugracilis]|uniref:protein bric-a-brac 2 isoform X2 n=1 Tax=Drosophila eugracilis TaxID=29029 RepID=UPI0007E79852|nr:protein bric-a-brac 2 isoform X2 [Drosophila eugracilis]
MDMTKQIVDFELKSECEVDQYEPSDYTMPPLDEPKVVMEPQFEEPEDLDMKYSPERMTEPTSEEQKEVANQPEKETESLGHMKSPEKDMESVLVKPKESPANDEPLTPPPRPLTSSEVVGLRDPDDPELRLRLEAKKSRSLPVSPQPQQSLKMAGSALFEFGQRSSPAEAKIKPNPEVKPPRRKMAPPSGGGDNQQFCLRWNNYQSNLTNVFDELLQSESFVDVTLSCEGHSIKAHKMVLSACSPYFQALFYDNPCQHPIIIMRDVNWTDLKALVEFMYKGEINVCQDQINPLLKVAETLKIRGLAEVSAGRGDGGASAHPMSVYDEEEEEEEELASATAILRQDDEADQEMKAKRPRLLPEGVLDLNQRQRKRSRDGSYATPSPSLQGGETESTERGSSATPGQNQSQPLAMTTSTIVRNPFASPNPQTLDGRNSGSTSGGNQRNSPQPSSGHSNGNSGAAMHSPPGGVAAQSALPPHMAAAVAAAAHHAAVVPPPPPAMHHHAAATAAQQLAAHHQLAHSHAMASALAAAAVGAGGTGSGSGSGPSAPTGGAGAAGSASASSVGSHHDDMEIKPEIAEMIREEERAKMIESGGHGGWMGAAAAATGAASVADSYQYQLQSMWQKCWNTNQQNLVQQLRFRERGPLKSWRPEAMAEAIFSVLKEGLSLSQAARKYDIPYPTFVLYANRVHNMLGPSLDGGADPRPKARGRPQRILLGMWPEELIRSVIKAVVFRDYREIKEDMSAHQYANGQAHGSYIGGSSTSNGYHSAAAAKMAAQNAALAPPDAGSPLSSMTETLRRQILSQQQQHHHQQQSHHQQQPSHHQQQSPHGQSMNMYKSPAYLQRSEIEDQVSAAAAVAAAAAKHQQQGDRRGSENLPDLSALGLMGLPGLNVMPSRGSGGGSGGSAPNSAASYARELSRERERDRERERERELSRQYGSQSRGSSSGSGSAKSLTASQRPGAASPYSAAHYAKHQASAYNKRFLESLPAGIDFEAIANGLLQKSVNKSPRFEDFFPGPGQDMSELFANPDAAAAAAAAAAYAPPGGAGGGAIRESPLMKIKLEQQHATELPHED